MSNPLNVFLEPGKLFAELKEKPTFWLPLLLMVVVNIAMMLGYFSTVDSDWMIDHQLQASGREMSSAEIEQAKAVMPSARTMGMIAAPSAVVMILVMNCLYALYYMLAGKLTGNALRFKQGFVLSTWAAMPMLLSALIGLVGVFGMSPQTPLESLMLTHLDPLLVELPLDSAWSGFAKGFDLLMFWSLGLVALGWKQWHRSSWTQAIVVAVLPALLIYGIWALVALSK